MLPSAWGGGGAPRDDGDNTLRVWWVLGTQSCPLSRMDGWLPFPLGPPGVFSPELLAVFPSCTHPHTHTHTAFLLP